MGRQHSANCFAEAAPNGFLRPFEISPRSGPAGMEFSQRLLGKVKRRSRRVSLEISASPVAFNGIAPLRNLPLELHFWLRSRLGQINLHALARGLDVANVHESSERRRP